MTTAGDPGLVVVGAGGHGREVLDIVEACGLAGRFVGFVDDNEPTPDTVARLSRRGVGIVGDVSWLASTAHDWIVAIGTSVVRRRIDEQLRDALRDPVVLVHPSAEVGSDNRLAPGVVVGVHSTITTNVTVGRHTHVNVGCSVQHDSVLGDYVTMSPGVFVNGDVVIGDDVFLGTGAIVTRGCTVGAGATIGAGAVVRHDVAPGSRVLGVPARPS
jgi:sugar O-acyltransferase (sialic acid O-acetyltransferase NeuD family)